MEESQKPIQTPETTAGERHTAKTIEARKLPPRRFSWFILRNKVERWQAVLLGALCILICGLIWWSLTNGPTVEERLLSPSILPSPTETFGDFKTLWFKRELTRNTYASLRRVTLGFGLAALVGIPLGVLCGCFPWTKAFFAPLTLMGRNVPVAALIPLTFSFFGIDEFQKVMFIFIACVAFIVDDTASAVWQIENRFIDTAYTLGANRRQIIFKVIFPLALPSIFNSLRLLFGLAFGYIMLAELINSGDSSGGLGYIINISSRLGYQSHIILVLLLIPIVAFGIDRILFWIQRELFPYRYGGTGILRHALGAYFVCWEEFKSLFYKKVDFESGNSDKIHKSECPK